MFSSFFLGVHDYQKNSHTSAHPSFGAYTKAHMSAHTTLEAQTSAHTSLGAHMSAHMSPHTSLGAHTSTHTSARMCALLPRDPTLRYEAIPSGPTMTSHDEDTPSDDTMNLPD